MIWINVGMLMDVGPHAGIPRVISALVRQYAKNARVKFCCISFELAEYVEVPLEDVMQIIDQEKRPEKQKDKYIFLAKINRAIQRIIIKRWLNLFGKLKLIVGYHGKVFPSKIVNFTSCDTLFNPGIEHRELLNPECMLALKKKPNAPKFVFLIHDLIPIIRRDCCGESMSIHFEKWLRGTLKCADSIIAISEYTKKDLTGYAQSINVAIPTVNIIRLCDEVHTDEEAKYTPQGHITQLCENEFVLTVGTIEIRKNHLLLYQVWRSLIENNKELKIPKLVFAGTLGWRIDELLARINNDPVTQGHIIILEGVPNRDLHELYKNCLFTMFPSFYEGWGLPVAESLNFGKCCIASQETSIPEIGGDLIDYIDPYDYQNCYDTVLHYLKNRTDIKNKEAVIRSSYQETTEAAFAKNLLNFLQEKLEAS